MRKSLHDGRYAKVRIVAEVLVPEDDPLFRFERTNPTTNNVQSTRALRHAMSVHEDNTGYKLVSAKRTRVIARDLSSHGNAVIEPAYDTDCEADVVDAVNRALLGDDEEIADADDSSDTPASSADTNWDFAVV